MFEYKVAGKDTKTGEMREMSILVERAPDALDVAKINGLVGARIVSRERSSTTAHPRLKLLTVASR